MIFGEDAFRDRGVFWHGLLLVLGLLGDALCVVLEFVSREGFTAIYAGKRVSITALLIAVTIQLRFLDDVEACITREGDHVPKKLATGICVSTRP